MISLVIQENILRNDISLLTKEQLSTILGNNPKKAKKEDAIEELLQQMLDNEVLIKKIYNDFQSTLAMLPTQLEEYLNITVNERKRWTENKKLPVIEQRSFKKWGKVNYYPVYNRYLVYQITEEQIQNWRKEDEQVKTQNRLKGLEKAKETKAINNNIREDFKKEWKSLIVKWKKVNPSIAVTYQLSYWCMWVSRWAKEYQLKAANSISVQKSEEYKQRSNELYQLKNKAIKMLLLSPYKSIGFYQPKNNNKVNFHMCDSHYKLWAIEREESLDYLDKWEFLRLHQKEIKECSKCIYEVNEDYYSLFHLAIESNDIPDFRFSFHTPYTVGKDFFPNSKSLKKVEHQEQDGMFRFGRPLFDKEKIIYREKDVLKYFENAMNEFSLYFLNN